MKFVRCVALLGLLALPLAAPAAAGRVLQAPRIALDPPGFVGHGLSLNWAGYVSFPNNGSGTTFSEVDGSWTQPTATCQHKATSYAAFFVGLDGNTSSTVEQIGTQANCSKGTPTSFAWYKMFPNPPVNLTSVQLPVSPGDSISAFVAHDNGTCPGADNFQLSITNNTTSDTYSTCATLTGTQRTSAEWITESPVQCVAKCTRILPLTNFGSVTFTGAKTTGGATTGAIDNSAWQDDPLTMVTRSLNPRATPGSLSDTPDTTGTSSFTVTWNQS